MVETQMKCLLMLKTNTVSSSEYQGRGILRKKIKRKQWIQAIIRALKSMLTRIEVGYSSSSCQADVYHFAFLSLVLNNKARRKPEKIIREKSQEESSLDDQVKDKLFTLGQKFQSCGNRACCEKKPPGQPSMWWGRLTTVLFPSLEQRQRHLKNCFATCQCEDLLSRQSTNAKIFLTHPKSHSIVSCDVIIRFVPRRTIHIK